MKKFPVTYADKPVGVIQLPEEIVLTLETLMKKKFESLDAEPFLISATFQSDTEKMSMKLLSINILEKLQC